MILDAGLIVISFSPILVHLNEGFSTIKDYIFVVGTPKYTFKTPEPEVGINGEYYYAKILCGQVS